MSRYFHVTHAVSTKTVVELRIKRSFYYTGNTCQCQGTLAIRALYRRKPSRDSVSSARINITETSVSALYYEQGGNIPASPFKGKYPSGRKFREPVRRHKAENASAATQRKYPSSQEIQELTVSNVDKSLHPH